MFLPPHFIRLHFNILSQMLNRIQMGFGTNDGSYRDALEAFPIAVCLQREKQS